MMKNESPHPTLATLAAARCVWWTVDYVNAAALASYQSNRAVFIAEEDPQAEQPEKYYTVVIPNPDLNPGNASSSPASLGTAE